MREIVGLLIKGILIGGTLTVPGVSGGSVAMILGVYEKILQAMNILISRNGKKKMAFQFLAVALVGGVLGILAISRPISLLLEKYPIQMIFLFCGAISGGIPLIWREGKGEDFKYSYLFYIFIGIACVLFLQILPQGLFSIGENRSFWGVSMQFVGGMISALALVLPGISVSHILYVLGIYSGIIQAISSLDFLILIPFALGLSLGVLLSARMVDRLLVYCRSQTYMVILGFVIGSVFELIRSGKDGGFNIICIPMFIIGYCLVYLCTKKGSA
jgi:putative membrane protein